MKRGGRKSLSITLNWGTMKVVLDLVVMVIARKTHSGQEENLTATVFISDLQILTPAHLAMVWNINVPMILCVRD